MVKEVAGHRFYVWELPPDRANEALDCRVYSYGALCGLLHFGLRLNAITARATRPYGDTDITAQQGDARACFPVRATLKKPPFSATVCC
ncbi:phage terminase large subunit GpA-like protein [Paraburkholderia sp. HC6.4b]|nr:phage terminase large subunit GpA-like protein [Paraburkholderia sp. HC6.4b]MBB5453227.1 phage terminase large subunit GpA-like protein [Paraburkholderia sp. Kb1A]